MEIINVSNLDVAYGGNLALHDVSLKIQAGEYVCIIGENGSGKSTFIKALFGLVKAVRGALQFGVPMEKISYLPQINLAQRDFPATVREVVLCGTQKKNRAFSFYGKKEREQALNAIRLLEIEPIMNRRIGDLSGGQQQRALLARALCREPKLLILDEPCAGLDAAITEELYEILAKLNREQGVTIVMASHDLAQVEKYAGRVVVLNHGVDFDGSPQEWQFYRASKGGM